MSAEDKLTSAIIKLGTGILVAGAATTVARDVSKGIAARKVKNLSDSFTNVPLDVLEDAAMLKAGDHVRFLKTAKQYTICGKNTEKSISKKDRSMIWMVQEYDNTRDIVRLIPTVGHVVNSVEISVNDVEIVSRNKIADIENKKQIKTAIEQARAMVNTSMSQVMHGQSPMLSFIVGDYVAINDAAKNCTIHSSQKKKALKENQRQELWRVQQYDTKKPGVVHLTPMLNTTLEVIEMAVQDLSHVELPADTITNIAAEDNISRKMLPVLKAGVHVKLKKTANGYIEHDTKLAKAITDSMRNKTWKVLQFDVQKIGVVHLCEVDAPNATVIEVSSAMLEVIDEPKIDKK